MITQNIFKKFQPDDLIVITEQSAFLHQTNQPVELDTVERLKLAHVIEYSGNHKQVPDWGVWRITEAITQAQRRQRRTQHLTPADKLDNLLSQAQRRHDIESYTLEESEDGSEITGHILVMNPDRMIDADEFEDSFFTKYHKIGWYEKAYFEPDTGEFIKLFFHLTTNREDAA